MRQYLGTIARGDVGCSRRNLAMRAAEAIGTIQPGDIGKRVYLFSCGTVQVESTEQRDNRLREEQGICTK